MGQRRPTRGVGNLPSAVTSFVGRQREIREVRALLATARLVTLTGVGGVGKTRLATEVAAASGRSFPDGSWPGGLGRRR
ncbi:ATP-binding protein [Nocardia gamkensis]|uniref:ATP-binding protein n=1 Tax=Nocardia gamkensis TaxID=352869 RepID=UPI0033D5796E